MKKIVRDLAEEAGFVFWQDDEWKPLDADIDWSSDYSKELETLCDLIVRKCAQVASELSFSPEGPSHETKYQRELCARAIEEYFGLQSKSPVSNRNEYE